MPGFSPHAPFRPFLAAFLLFAGALRAQSPVSGEGASEVEALRATFEATVASTLEPLNRKYVAALRRMEKELAIAKDYEAAIALRDERLAVEGMLASTGTAGAKTGNGTLDTASATGAGTAVTSAKENRFEAATGKPLNGAERQGEALRLSAAGQAVQWAVTDLPAGGYDVVVTYTSAAAATFQVKEHFFRLACEAPSSGGGEGPKTQSFGTLKVTSRVSAITLTLESVSEDSPLLIHEVKLVSNQG